MGFIRICKKCGSYEISTKLFSQDLIKSKAEIVLLNIWHKFSDDLDKIDIKLYSRNITKDKESGLKEERDIVINNMEEIEDIFYKIKDFNKWQHLGKIFEKALYVGGAILIAGIIFMLFHLFGRCG